MPICYSLAAHYCSYHVILAPHAAFMPTSVCTKGTVACRFAAKASHAAPSLRVMRVGRRRLQAVWCTAAAGAHRLCSVATAVSFAATAAAAIVADSSTAGAAVAAGR